MRKCYWVLLSSTEFYWVLLSATECYWVLLRATECDWVRLSSTECYWVLLSITEYYWVLLNTTECYWVLLNATEFYWVPKSVTECYWVHVKSKPRGLSLVSFQKVLQRGCLSFGISFSHERYCLGRLKSLFPLSFFSDLLPRYIAACRCVCLSRNSWSQYLNNMWPFSSPPLSTTLQSSVFYPLPPPCVWPWKKVVTIWLEALLSVEMVRIWETGNSKRWKIDLPSLSLETQLSHCPPYLSPIFQRKWPAARKIFNEKFLLKRKWVLTNFPLKSVRYTSSKDPINFFSPSLLSFFVTRLYLKNSTTQHGVGISRFYRHKDKFWTDTI